MPYCLRSPHHSLPCGIRIRFPASRDPNPEFDAGRNRIAHPMHLGESQAGASQRKSFVFFGAGIRNEINAGIAVCVNHGQLIYSFKVVIFNRHSQIGKRNFKPIRFHSLSRPGNLRWGIPRQNDSWRPGLLSSRGTKEQENQPSTYTGLILHWSLSVKNNRNSGHIAKQLNYGKNLSIERSYHAVSSAMGVQSMDYLSDILDYIQNKSWHKNQTYMFLSKKAPHTL